IRLAPHALRSPMFHSASGERVEPVNVADFSGPPLSLGRPPRQSRKGAPWRLRMAGAEGVRRDRRRRAKRSGGPFRAANARSASEGLELEDLAQWRVSLGPPVRFAAAGHPPA